MSDSQEEKIKFLIKDNGFGIDEAIQKMGISKQTFYNNIRKYPLSPSFKLIFKEKLGIDLGVSLISKEIKKPDQEDRAEKDLQAEVKRLKDEIMKLQAELLEFYKRK